ncbi:MAG: CPBP family intramembrane metalloprotease [Candidatus Diapherotrites archaeon]|nr:CPBP family intramembrane metalloprotease [Candidatus Diapherotrites archaeon]
MVYWLLDIFFVFVPLSWLWIEKGLKPPLSKEKAGALLRELGLRKENAIATLKKAATLLGFLLLAAFLLGIPLTLLGLNDTALVEKTALEVLAVPLLAAYILLVRVPCEEIFFRGFLFRELSKSGPAIGIIGSSLVFALAHYGYGSIGEIIGALALGALLAAFYYRSKNLTINILAHMAYNFIIFLSLMW